MRPINEIIVHCTATRPDWWAGKRTSEKVAEIKRWHVQDRGWSDIGYHYLIDRDGTVANGRPIEKVGAHVAGHNTGTIGISLFGGHGSAETDQFADHYTPAQEAALRKLIADLRKRFGVLKITGHNQYAAKACPGFNVPDWFRNQNTIKTIPIDFPHVEPELPKSWGGDQNTVKSFWACLFAAIAAIFGKGKA
jgi:N-acetylmuramoyl-L-alanine amidase